MLKNEEKVDSSPKTSKSKAKGVFDKIKSIKHIDIIIAVVVIAVMLIIYFSTFAASSSDKSDGGTISSEDYCESVTKELEAKLSKVEGAGNVSLLINWGSSEVKVPATSSTSSGGKTIVTVGGQIHILEVVYPTPKGVIVICDGAKNISVKINLISAVSSYFGISENTITVLTRS